MDFSGRLILLDVEGTVSPLAFVHDVMFPFARQGAEEFLKRNALESKVLDALERMAQDAGHDRMAAWCPFPWPSQEGLAWVVAQIHGWMDADAKLTGLKQFQGLVWEEGFNNGVLCATLFDDVAPVLKEWHALGLKLQIYSSGSVHAQKLFFSHTIAGDLTPLLSGYYDTTVGPKRVAASYAAIAAAAGTAPGDVLFLSDIAEELDAAKAAGMQTGLAIRPGNRETEGARHATLCSLRDITFVSP